MLEIEIDGKKAKPVLINGVQVHPVNRRVIHIDLFLVKMTEGRIRKFLGEITFVGQPFIKDPDQTIEKLLASAGREVPLRITGWDDLPAVLALYAQPDMDDGRVLPLQEAQQLLAQFARYPNYHLYVACDNAQPANTVGTFALLVMHNLAHCGTPSAIVEDVVVSPAHQGRGIGHQMMEHARNLEFEQAARTRDQLAKLRAQAFGASGKDNVAQS